MQAVCPSCGHLMEYSSRPPRFCSDCGPPVEPELDGRTRAVISDDQAPTRAYAGGPGKARGVPDRIGGYRLLRPLGSGGMGTVYEAAEPGSGRHVAIKVIQPDFADSHDAL